MAIAQKLPHSHTEYLALRRFGVLDGLRAISIVLVFTAHPASLVFWPLLHGATGVTLFFVLSGFLITTLLLREESRNNGVDLRAFYIRRTFRIYPVFFAVLGIYCILILVLGVQAERREAFVENLPYFVLLFPEHSMFFNTNSFSVPFNGSWSIGIEEKFYLIWPILGFVIMSRLKTARLPFLCALGCIAFALNFANGNWASILPYQHILYGAIAALALHSQRGYNWLSKAGHTSVLAVTFAVALLMQFGSSEALPGGSLYGPYGLVLTLVLAGVVTTKASFVRWLSSRPMVYLGAISYVIYLIHNFVINAAESIIPDAWGFPGSLLSTSAAFAGTIFIAHFVHKYFEEPLRRFGVRLSKTPKKPAQISQHTAT